VNLVLIESGEADAGGTLILDGPRRDHLIEVLKVAPGQPVRVGIIDGPRGTATVETVAATTITLRCRFEDLPPPVPPVDLLLALPRPKVMRRLWAQVAALGVGQIILTNAAKVERHYFDSHVLAPATYRPLLIEGLQQARDTRVPRVSIHRQFRALIEDQLDTLYPDGLRLVAAPGARTPPSAAVDERGGGRVLLAIGPEGGWNPFETALLAAHGFRAVSMGARTLRTDTACVAMLALVHAAG
jgi:RsmE family RNA methyltransferase